MMVFTLAVAPLCGAPFSMISARWFVEHEYLWIRTPSPLA